MEAPKVQRRGEGKLVTTLNELLAADREIDFTESIGHPIIEKYLDNHFVYSSFLTAGYDMKTRATRNRTGDLLEVESIRAQDDLDL